jgi:Actinobacteria/chloroflexi VLRF1 release factor
VRHGQPSVQTGRDGVELSAPDGASALLAAPFGPWSPPAGGPVEVAAALAQHAAAPRRVGVLVVRRGGYAAAVVADGEVVASKVGRRHVQGRTAAGGWSQQRFARRRAKQTAELADASAAVAARILAESAVEWLVTGGDRPLVDAVLAEPALRRVAALPRGPHLAVGDPDAALVRGLPVAVTRVRVTLREPA